MSTTLKISDSVGSWVSSHPATSRVFEQHNIDYCCGGNRSLEEACRIGTVDARAVLGELMEVVSENGSQPQDDFSVRSLTDMCDSIVETHHEYLKRELPRLTQLVDKVISVHGDQYSWLTSLKTAYTRLRDELTPHMFKEEQVLFPAIRTIEQSGKLPIFPFGSVDNPIRMMVHEHDVAGQALREIRVASADFTLPHGGCNTFRAMLEGLRELEADLHQHIHKENNILFPQASRLASQLSGTPEGNCGV
jgi:regulator of cell morphogenesis and NO signaling